MKKAYINPEMEIIEIDGQVLLAGSPFGIRSAGYNSESESLAPEYEGDDF